MEGGMVTMHRCLINTATKMFVTVIVLQYNTISIFFHICKFHNSFSNINFYSKSYIYIYVFIILHYCINNSEMSDI